MKLVKLSIVSVLFAAATVLLGCSSAQPESIDLDKVLGITAATLERFEAEQAADPQEDPMAGFALALQTDLNNANPKLHSQPVGVEMAEDGSIHGYSDANSSASKDSGEQELFKIEIDGENNRMVASAHEYVREHRFSGMSFIAGMMIGNMLSRQRSAGINPSSISSKTASPMQSARSRSGSGSHASGK